MTQLARGDATLFERVESANYNLRRETRCKGVGNSETTSACCVSAL
jgi:hypothetical protein